MRERWRWHGRPAREITRKMRVPHLNCATFERRRMISDWRDWGHSGEGQKEKRSRDPLSPTRFSPDNRTQSARRTPKTTLLDCSLAAAINACNARLVSRSKRTRGAQEPILRYARRPVCRAAMPPLKFSNSTSSNPAARIMPTRVS